MSIITDLMIKFSVCFRIEIFFHGEIIIRRPEADYQAGIEKFYGEVAMQRPVSHPHGRLIWNSLWTPYESPWAVALLRHLSAELPLVSGISEGLYVNCPL